LGGAGGQGGQGGDVRFGGSGGIGGAGGDGGTAGAPGHTAASAVIGRGGHGGLGGKGGNGGNAGPAGLAQVGGLGGAGGIGGSALGGGVYVAVGTVTILGGTLQGDSAVAGGGGAGGAGGTGGQESVVTNRSYGAGRAGIGGRGGTGGIADHINISQSGKQAIYAGTAGNGGAGGNDGMGGSGASAAAGGAGGLGGNGGEGNGGGVFVVSGTITLVADTLARNAASGGAGGPAGQGGAGGVGGAGGTGGPYLGSHTGAIPSFSFNHGGSGGAIASYPATAHLAAGASGPGGVGGNGGKGGVGGNGGVGGPAGQGGTGGAGGGGGIFISGGSLTSLNDTIAANSVAAGAAGPSASGGQAGAGGAGGFAGHAGAGGLADHGHGVAAAAGTAGTAGASTTAGTAGAPGKAGTAGAAAGGGVEIAAGSAVLDNSTIALNTQGGGVVQQGGTVTAVSTLFAGNGSLDYQGSVAASNSLFQTTPTGMVTGSNNLVGVDPKLDTSGLADNGGPTQTIVLQAGSPAIGAGANPENLFTDQRGDAPRTGSGGTDIGADQFAATPDTQAPTASLQAALVNAANATALSPYTFTIAYSDNVAIAPASLSGALVQVVPPGNGTPITATVVSTTPMGATDPWGDAQTFDVVYQITPPGVSWTESDDGAYTVTAGGTLPTDLAGNTLSPGTVGSFDVQVFTGTLDVSVDPLSPVTAGMPFGLTVEAKDAGGNVIGNFDEEVTLTLASQPGPASLGGTVSMPAVNGVATFSGVLLDQAGTGYMIQAAAVGLTSATTTSFDVVASTTVSKLVVTGEPPTGIAADTGFPLTVKAYDAYNNLVSTYGGPITVAIEPGTGPLGAVLGGTITHDAQGGVWTFSGLTLDTAGAYMLQATATGAMPATTTTINVTPAAVLQFDSAKFTANVTDGSASIQIDRSGNLGATVTALFSSPGDSDVAAFSQMVSLGPNVTSDLVSIPVINDGLAGEGPVNVPLSLSSPGAGATLGTPVSSSLQIQDDNPPAVIQLGSAQTGANVTDGSASIVLKRSSDLGATVSVVVSSPGGSDVAAFSKTVSFGPNVTSQAVSVPIINNGVYGESDVDISLKLASPSSGATLGAVSSGTLVIHDNNPPPPPPPPLVTMTKVMDKTNKKHQVTEVDVIFSGLVNSAEADTLTTYRLATPGKKGSYTAKNAKIIKLKTALYTASTNTVALTPKKPFFLTKPVQVLVYGTGPNALQDAEGRLIDGDHNGTAGGNAIAIIAKHGVTYAAVPLARTAARTPVRATAAVDALLARGELAGLRDSLRIERAGHHLISH